MGQDLLLGILLPAALFLIMLGMGMTLSLADFLRVRQAPATVLVGVSGQLLLPPVAALITLQVFPLEPVFAVGLMILSFAPSGATSNLMTYLSRGDVALAVSLTAVSSLLVPFTMPLLSAWVINLWLDQSVAIELPLLATWTKLMLVSLLPVLLGMMIASNWPRLALRATRALKPLSFVFLLLVIVAISGKHWERMPGFLAATAPAVLLMNVLALLAGWVWAWLWRQDEARRVTIGLEVGVLNGGTALVVTLMVLGDAQMSVPPVIYGILMLGPSLAFGLLLGARLRRRSLVIGH